MKHLIFAAALLLTPLAHADQSHCERVGILATSIMEARQSGAPMSELMKIADGNKLLQLMVVQAYEEPRFSSDRYQQNATNDFRAEWELACYKAMKGAT